MAALALLTLSGAALELDSSNFDKEVSHQPSQIVLRTAATPRSRIAPRAKGICCSTALTHLFHPPQVFKSGKSAFIKFLAPW